ncbi:dephospho-CoA kinase [candidate division KSB1 bacterium]|nr:dephospho-CoA kinase [candidate division KSB1 bacterium]TDJ02842.1 MAG: dephospho-CoA kinase [Caldithrix sp.]
MILFGVTGGIGSGKTAVCNFLKEKKIPIIEADPLARDLTNHSPEIRQTLVAEFGKDVYLDSGNLNKDLLSQLVFSDAATRERVNQIIHPPVFKAIQDRVNQLKQENQSLAGVEAALIFESKMERILNAVIVVAAPMKKRIEWIKSRDGFSQEEILKRINSQMPLEEKIKRADYVIDNDHALSDLAEKVDELYNWLSSKI